MNLKHLVSDESTSGAGSAVSVAVGLETSDTVAIFNEYQDEMTDAKAIISDVNNADTAIGLLSMGANFDAPILKLIEDDSAKGEALTPKELIVASLEANTNLMNALSLPFETISLENSLERPGTVIKLGLEAKNDFIAKLVKAFKDLWEQLKLKLGKVIPATMKFVNKTLTNDKAITEALSEIKEDKVELKEKSLEKVQKSFKGALAVAGQTVINKDLFNNIENGVDLAKELTKVVVSDDKATLTLEPSLLQKLLKKDSFVLTPMAAKGKSVVTGDDGKVSVTPYDLSAEADKIKIDGTFKLSVVKDLFKKREDLFKKSESTSDAVTKLNDKYMKEIETLEKDAKDKEGDEIAVIKAKIEVYKSAVKINQHRAVTAMDTLVKTAIAISTLAKEVLATAKKAEK